MVYTEEYVLIKNCTTCGGILLHSATKYKATCRDCHQVTKGIRHATWWDKLLGRHW